VSAEIISLCEWRAAQGDVPPVLDALSAIDVAIRDLSEIEMLCDSAEARQRAADCRQMLYLALTNA
jgi:hypothetical protein